MTTQEPTLNLPDRVRTWFITHPNRSARPGTIAEAVGGRTHPTAQALNTMLAAGEVARTRPNDNTNGPGVLYVAAPGYAKMRTLADWKAHRKRIVAAEQQQRREAAAAAQETTTP